MLGLIQDVGMGTPIVLDVANAAASALADIAASRALARTRGRSDRRPDHEEAQG